MICDVYDRMGAPGTYNETNPNTKMAHMLKLLCQEYNLNIYKLADSVNDMYRNIANEVKATHFIRSRRSLLPFVSEILRDLFGTAVDTDTSKLNKKFSSIRGLILAEHNATKMLETEFVGITKLLDARTKQVDKALIALGIHLSKIDSQIDVVWQNINRNINEGPITFSLNMIEALNSAVSSIYNVSLFQSIFASYEHALLQLRSGVLPLNIVPFSELQLILNKVQEVVRPNYDLAIDNESYMEYYILPLATVSITSEEIFIRLTIPLKHAGSPVMYNILSPIASPIPCSHQACSFNSRITNSTRYITLDLKSSSWLSDRTNSRILGEVNLFDLNCIPIGTSQLCYSFESAIITEPSLCSNSLWHWNQNEIVEDCHFVLSPTAVYKPVKVLDNAFVLHRDELKTYDLLCPGRNSD
jgi:hypothetical protein